LDGFNERRINNNNSNNETINNMELTNNDIFSMRLALQEQIKEANKWLAEAQEHERQGSIDFWQGRSNMYTETLNKLEYK